MSRALSPEGRAARFAPSLGVLDVVIDTDAGNEIDDQFAMVWALLRSDRLRIRGFTACPFGLSPELLGSGAMLAELDARRFRRRLEEAGVDLARVPRFDPGQGVRRAYQEISRVLEAAGSDAPVRLGAERYLTSPTEPESSDAARFLVETAGAAGERPLYVAAIGCLTNVASALLLDPSLADRIVVVWTAAYPSFWPGRNASYNLAQDLHAARVVLGSGVPLVYLPGYYVGEELRVTKPEIDAYVAGQGALGALLHALFVKHAGEGYGPGRSKVLWDLVAIAWLLDPAWFVTREVATPILDDALRWVSGDRLRPPMLEAVDVDRDAIFTDFYRCLAAHAS